MATFVFYLAVIGAVLSGSLVFPVLVSFGFQEFEIGFSLLMFALLGAFISVAILLSVIGRTGDIDRNRTIVLAITTWVFFPIVFSFPVSVVGELSITDALFQSFSAFTTTGAMVFENIDQKSRGFIFMLAQLQWFGGVGTLITLVLVLAPWRIGGLPVDEEVSIAASVVASEHRLTKYCLDIFQAYTIVTVGCFALLLISGVGAFDASVLSFTTLSTGGILPSQSSLDSIVGNSGLLILTVFLIIGATSIFWQSDVFNLRATALSVHRETYYVFATIGILSAFITYMLLKAAGSTQVLSGQTALIEGVFNATSIVSTSGIQSRPGVFAIIPHLLVIILVFIGGGCFSTSGGIKHFRIGGMYHYAEFELNRLIYPSLVSSKKAGDTTFDMQINKALWTIFTVLIIVLGLGTFALSVTGLEFQQSFTAAAAALSNAGPIYGQFWGSGTAADWPTYEQMLGSQKTILIIIMVLGRLEVIAIFASISVLIRTVRSQFA